MKREKQELEVASSSEPSWAARLPSLPPGARSRPLFFRDLPREEEEALRVKGYDPVSVFTLPRGEAQDEVNYLLAKAQGIEEGTIFARDEEINILELEMRANRMLGQRYVVARINVDAGKQNVLELLKSWTSSRHTLQGNTTIEEARRAPALPEPQRAKKKGKK